VPPIEYGRNFVETSPLFERSCDLGLFRLTADKLWFGFRFQQRIPGKRATVLERMDPL